MGAVFLVDMAHYSGLVAAGVYPNPCEHADIVTSTTHKTLRGPRAGMILAKEKFGAAIDKAVFPGAQGGRWSTSSRQRQCASSKRCRRNSRLPAAGAGERAGLSGLVAGRGFRIISGGTDSHVMLIDVFAKGVKGKEAEKALDEAYITANKNAIPFDTNPPLNPSGIRLGSPAVTTRGFREAEMKEVGRLVANVLNDVKSEQVLAQARRGVGELTSKFPLYAWKQQAVTAH